MQNYSDVFAQTLDEFESPYVPANQGDAGKGQVTVRAGYKINTTLNSNIGYISKSPGQTQFAGVSVDALLDKSDATGADYLTDVDAGNGMREIRLAYTPYPIPPPGTPATGWVQPTESFLTVPGPLVLKDTPYPVPPDGIPAGYPPDAPWPPPPIYPVWAPPTVQLYGYDWYALMAGNVENIYLNLLYRWSDFKGAANWLKNIREDGMTPEQMVAAVKESDEYKALHP